MQEVGEVQGDVAVRALEGDADELGRGGLLAHREQLLQALHPPLRFLAPLGVPDGHDRAVSTGHESPRMLPSRFKTRLRILSPSTRRTAPYSSGGTLRRTAPSPSQGR